MLLGDKEEKDKYKMYNEGYVPDLVRPGASAWGTDWIGESKVASPLTKAGPGVGCQDVGHTHAVLGCRKRGTPGEVYDHASGRGFVDFHPGDYYDALRRKNNQVALLLVEVFGGLAGGGARLLRFMSRRAEDKKRGRDGTKYSKFHPENSSPTTSPRLAWRPCTRTPATSTTA